MAAKSLLSKDQDTTDCYKKTTIKNTTRSKPIINLNEHLYVVGFNSSRQLGFTSKKHITELTKWNNKMNIKSIHCSANVTAYLSCIGKLYISGYGGGTNESAHMSELQLGRRDIYNNMNNININKICASVPGRCIFCITNNNKLYGYGRNKSYQLGLSDNINRYEYLDLITNLQNVINISPSYLYSIALCNPSLSASIIIQEWARKLFIIIPTDVIKLIKLFSNFNIVYSTGEFLDICNKQTWSIMKEFEDKEIIQIECGRQHSVFLESNGNIWTYGVNNYYQLGVNKELHYKTPVLLNNFVKAKINIIDIKCGRHHNLVLGHDGNVYSWGCNVSGQCGHGTSHDVKKPRIITALEQYKCIKIKCGAFHSCVIANDSTNDINDKLHFLFGDNNYNECTLLQSSDKKIKKPRCIDETVRILTNMIIKKIYLGYGNTFIVVKKRIR